MSFHHLFCTNAAIAQEASTPFVLGIDPIDRDHIRALRLQPGEHLAVVDASADYFEVEIERIEGQEIWVRIAQHLDAPTSLPITLVQGLAKGEKMDAVVRQSTELGIDAFAPVVMQRSIVRLDRKKALKRHERFCSIARAAALQSGRTSLPAVLPIADLADIIAGWSRRDAVLLFWEECPLERSIQRLIEQLDEAGTLASYERFWIMIGPEGGIAPEEIASIETSAADVFTLSLGPTILRTETAGVVACALAISELREKRSVR